MWIVRILRGQDRKLIHQQGSKWVANYQNAIRKISSNAMFYPISDSFPFPLRHFDCVIRYLRGMALF